MNEDEFSKTHISMGYTTDYQSTRADRIYAWVHGLVGGLLLMQIWLLVVAMALALPIAAIVGLVLLARHLAGG